MGEGPEKRSRKRSRRVRRGSEHRRPNIAQPPSLVAQRLAPEYALCYPSAMLLSFTGGLLLLVGGAELLVRGGSALARLLGVSPLVIGLTVVAYGTSLPEIVASAAAGAQGAPEMAIGNVLGSNIANVFLVLGIGALLRPIRLGRNLVHQLPILLLVSTLVPIGLLDGNLSRIEGIGLLCGAGLYMIVTLVRAKRQGRALAAREGAAPSPSPSWPPWLAGLSLAAGLVAVLVGAKLFVVGAVDLARIMGVSERTIGLTLVAFATSAPELATALVASLRGHGDLAVGNVIGSNLINILGGLGTAAVVHPLSGTLGTFAVDIAVMMAAAMALWMTQGRRGRLGRGGASVYLLAYAGWIAWTVSSHGG